jgi:hypothetical protein
MIIREISMCQYSYICIRHTFPLWTEFSEWIDFVPTVQPTRCTCYLKLFILVKRSARFGRSFHPLSGVQNCVYSNGICQTAAAIWDEMELQQGTAAVWHIPLLYTQFWARTHWVGGCMAPRGGLDHLETREIFCCALSRTVYYFGVIFVW